MEETKQEWTLESLKSHAYDVIGGMEKLKSENKVIAEYEALIGELQATNAKISEIMKEKDEIKDAEVK